MSMFDKFRMICKKNKLSNFLYNILKAVYYYCFVHVIAKQKLPKIIKELSLFHINDIISTINVLINSNKSIGRFGDGEISWMLDKNSGLGSFEKPSKSLSINLLRVIRSNNPNFMIGLPDSFLSLKNFKPKSKNYFIRFLVNNFQDVYPYLNHKKTYYDANVTRPYIDYNNKKNSGLAFYLLKKVWNNKNILIIEGSESRLGIKDHLLDNVGSVRRIECPTTNAFESYDKILHYSLKFLDNHKDYLSLISLGPTATVLSYDLCQHGFRAIDIGNIDIEYNWYLLGTNRKVDLPDHYVNELLGGQKVRPLNSKKYNREIIYNIK